MMSHSGVGKEELLRHCDIIFSKLAVTEDEAKNCEIDTQRQSKCKNWFSFRAGRITASKVKAVCRTSTDNPSKSLLKEICYPISKSFKAKPTDWGFEHEKDARKHYVDCFL